jgi:hypothetical protein
MWPPYPRVELLISQLFGFCGLGQTVENQISLPTIKVGKRTGGSLVKHFFYGPQLALALSNREIIDNRYIAALTTLR